MNMLSSFLSPLGKRSTSVQPFKELRQEVDKLFDSFGSGLGWPADWPDAFTGQSGSLVPNIEIQEDDKKITISSEIPGVDKKDLDVSIKDNVLTISGEKKQESETKEGEQVVTERVYGRFSRSTTLPFAVDEQAVDARYDKGVLTLTIKKPEEVMAKTKRVEIKVD